MKERPRQIGDLKIREIRTTIVLLITVLFFVICWVPLHIIDVLFALAPQSIDISIETINALIVLRHANYILNPFLYAYHMKGFKQSLRHALSKIFCCEGPRHPGWSSTPVIRIDTTFVVKVKIEE